MSDSNPCIVKHRLFCLFVWLFSIHLPSPPPSLFPPVPLIPRSTHCSLFPLQRRAGLPRMSTEHGITRCSRTRHKSSSQGQIRHSIRSNRLSFFNRFFLNVTHVYKICQSHTPITLSHPLLSSIIPIFSSPSPHHTFWSCLMLLSTL